MTLLTIVGLELGGPLTEAGIHLPSWIAQGGTCTYWAGATCLGSWNYVASFGSSTYECASDVSLFHLFHHPPSHLPVAFSLWLWLFALGFVVCFCFLGFASARVFLLVFSSRVLDDRQCFTARSARHKKKSVKCNLRIRTSGRSLQ